MNAMEWNRDLTQPVQAIRERGGMNDKPDRGKGTVPLPEMRKAVIIIAERWFRTNAEAVGYSEIDIDNIMYKNWIRFLIKAL